MMADIWDFFENMDELVYVADMDTYDMVYMNRRAMAQCLQGTFWVTQGNFV